MRGRVRASLEAGRFKVVPVLSAAPCSVLRDNDLKAFEPLVRAFANINTLDELSAEERA
jgi:molybdopterin-guanine dinucleotide biosynthesis protein A